MRALVLISNTEAPKSGNRREFLIDPLLILDCEFLTFAYREVRFRRIVYNCL